jgi:hypothetical protein
MVHMILKYPFIPHLVYWFGVWMNESLFNNISVIWCRSVLLVEKTGIPQKTTEFEFELWCLTPLSAIFQVYHGDQF